MVRPVTCLALALILGAPIALPVYGLAGALDPRIETTAQVYREQGAAKALPLFEKLAVEFAGGARRQDQAAVLHYVGECQWRLGNFAEARQYLDRALGLERAAGDALAQGRTLNVRGLLSWDEGDYPKAIEDFRRARALAREGSDRKLEGAALNNLSLVFDEQGEYDVSLEQYRRVLELYRGADFPRGVGDTLGNMGGVHLLLGRFREALGYYRQALEISQQLKSTTAISQDHGNIALCLLGLGDVEAALEHLDQAIGLATRAGMQQDRAYWLSVKAGARVEQGRYDLALLDYRDALTTYEAIGARAELVTALRGSGQLHLLLGDAAGAERDFRRALELSDAIGLDRGVTVSLVSLGEIEQRRGRAEEASRFYEQARQRAETAGMQQVLATTLLRLARVDRLLERLTEAGKRTGRALEIARDIAAPGLEAEALFARAELARLQGRHAQALDDYELAEQVGTGLLDPELHWQVLLGRARAQDAGGDPAAAIASLEAAIDLIEGVRSRLQEPRFRSGYLEDKFQVYLELMRLQLRQGRTADAFWTAERLRAMSFSEQLSGRTTVPMSTADRMLEVELRERVRHLRQNLAETDDDGASAYPERAMNRFSQELQAAESAYATFIDDRARLAARPDAAPSVQNVQRRLAADEALLEYVVAPDSVVVFVITARDLAVETLPVAEPELAARIALLRDLVQRPGDDSWLKPASRLFSQLVSPIERTGLLYGVTRLHVVPHGVLSYLPFALLPRSASAKAELLVDRYTPLYLPAAAALLREPPSTRVAGSLLAVAPARGGLLHAQEEARAVDVMFRPGSRALIGSDATESRFKELAGGFNMLHLATHGHFNEANPLLSGLEFEPGPDEDGMLQVHEVLDLRLQADLVTLSACDTALGTGYFTRLPRGDDFIGVNRAFLAAGSASVMATLWRVDDRASVALMKNFYGRLNEDRGGGAPEALASAQRAYRRSGVLGHPYYWAAYIVVGQNNREMEIAGRFPGGKS